MYLGIDIGGTTIKGGIIDANNNIYHIKSIDTQSNTNSENILKNIIDFISDYIVHHKDIKSVGIGVPGVVDEKGNILIAPNLNGFENVKFKEILSSHFNLPLIIDNDANVAAFAELYDGAGKGIDNFIYVTLGTGVGGAIIYQGKIFRGNSGGAGEIGHTIISLSGINNKRHSYKQSTLESFTSRNAIINFYKQWCIKSKTEFKDDIDVLDIYDFAKKNNVIAIKTFRAIGRYLGVGIASIMNLLDIPNVVIGGGISQAEEFIFPAIRKTIEKRALPSISTNFKVVKAKYINQTGIYGAALLGKSII